MFKDEFEHWIKKFGLSEKYDFVYTIDKKDSGAAVKVKPDPMDVTVYFGEEWEDTPLTRYWMCKNGFHEAAEVLLSELDRFITTKRNRETSESHRHEIINVLTKLLFEPSYRTRYGSEGKGDVL